MTKPESAYAELTDEESRALKVPAVTPEPPGMTEREIGYEDGWDACAASDGADAAYTWAIWGMVIGLVGIVFGVCCLIAWKTQ